MTISAYPDELATDVVLRDGGTLRLRPIRPEDDEKLLDLFRRMSQQSLYYRFMSIPRIDLEKAAQLTHVDYDAQVTLVGECNGALAAIAGYHRSEQCPDRAEVAFAIADLFQGRGIGTRLLERLAAIALERGVRAFDAYVLGDNHRMLDVFLESGFEVSQELERGVFHVQLLLEPTETFAARSAARSRRAAAASMRSFFEPRTIAVVGANREPGRIGSEILHNLTTTGFTGAIVPVHPVGGIIDGLQAYKRVSDIPFGIDLAVIVVPAAQVPAVVDDCIAKGVKALVVISAGFGETGPAGRAVEAQIVDKIRDAGIRMIGPNCMGIINTDPAFRLNATFSPVYPPEGRVAFSTQSGALGLAILDYVRTLNLGISSFASIGNKADVSGNDLIQYWAEDQRTDVILLYLESFGNPQKFGEIARRVGRRKPIVAVKAGRSSAGARAASSHTGARATSDALVDTLLRQAGVIRTGTLEELFDVAAVLAHQPVPAGRRVAIVTNAGGPGILAADACAAQGLDLPELAPETVSALRALLPPAASSGNPVDLLASASAEHYERSVELVLADPNVDSVMVIFIPPLVTAAEDVAAAIRRASAGSRKPVLATFMSSVGSVPLAPVPSFRFPEAAAVALARVTGYGQWLARPAGVVPCLAGFDREAARRVVARGVAHGAAWLTPSAIDELLTASGITAVESRLVQTAPEAVAAAAVVGYPVVLKAVGSSIVHKTDEGGVKLRITNENELREAYADLAGRLGVRLEGVLVQRMIPSGVEMVVGAVNDPAFGPLVMAGTGGVLVELVADTVFRLCPLTGVDADEMIEEMKGRVLLRGYRGSAPADEQAFRELLLRVSQLAAACPEIQEMDLNPVLVRQTGALVVDTRIRVGPKPPRVGGRRLSY